MLVEMLVEWYLDVNVTYNKVFLCFSIRLEDNEAGNEFSVRECKKGSFRFKLAAALELFRLGLPLAASTGDQGDP